MSWMEYSKHTSLSTGVAPLGSYFTKDGLKLPVRHESSWNEITAEVIELHGPGPYLAAHNSNKPLLVAALEEIGGGLETRLSPNLPSG